MLRQLEKKLPLKVKIRRWWKGYKSEIKWKGYIKPLAEDFIPGYYKLNRLYWSIRHRTFDIYHKVDTKLKPGYYDIDTLMLHSAFSLLCRFVEEEYKGVDKLEKRIADLGIWAEEEIERAKTEWTDKERLEEYIIGTREAHHREAKGYIEALRLYHWWKDVYPKYDDNSPISKHHDEMYSKDRPVFESKVCKVDADGDPLLYELVHDDDPARNELRKRIYEEEHEYDIKNEKEIEDNFISLVKLRKSLWT